ncbi:LexA family transcriptional regulator [Cupriavidus malaysiensis]|uniref:HTH cro/C1-type domain-containing protein n=1 Tax=Cupriavidus malaysiensis TaxID=367825 RepID=A0ABM6F5S5_9BURK|nr:XRE family transcriptional regulator [Cupriavidus malaysiensis]AOZ06792.1 hypothetical protein BKK80_13915 [Cupriavidus malaysiensis]
MPAQPLTDDQKRDAERLTRLFKDWQHARRAQGEPSSQEFASELLGFNQSALSQYLRGKIPLNVAAMLKWCALLRCDPSDISPDLAEKMREIADQVPDKIDSEFALVRRLDVKASAGPGRLVFLAGEKSRLAFRRDFLRDLGLSEKNAALVDVEGISMEPTLPDGAIVLINTQQEPIRYGKVYVVVVDGEVVVKRLARREGDIYLLSDNPNKDDFPDRRIAGESLGGFEIKGRAKWFGSRL